MNQNNTQKLFSFLPFLLAAFLWLGGSSVFAGGTPDLFIPSGLGISGGGSFCEDGATTQTLTASWSWVECSGSGNGSDIYPEVSYQWYTGSVTPGNEIAGASGTLAIGVGSTSATYNAPLTPSGSTDYYVEITWTSADVDWIGNCTAPADLGPLSAGPETVTVTSNQIANAGADQSPGDCSTTVTLAGNQITDGGTGTWSVSPAGPTPQAPFTANDYNAVYENLVAGTAYTFTWTSTNGGCSNNDQMIFNSAGPGCATYCTDPTPYTSSAAGYISNVNINSGAVNNPSPWNGYANFTGIGCANVVQGESFTVDVSITHNAAVTMNHFIWIDWNGDGVFDTSTEEYSLGTSTANTTLNLSDIIPCDAVVGTIRMRVASQYSGDPEPCVSSSIYGDVEDYCFTISADPTPTAVATSVYVPCATSATLDATGSSITSGYWTLIAGSGTITDPTAQSTTITGLLNGTTTLQWTSTANCATDTDQTTFVVSGLPDAPVDAGIDAYTCTDPFGLSASDPSPYPGAWSVISGPNVPGFSSITDPNATINGLVNGTYVLQWNITTASCGVVTDQVQVTFGSLPVADAGVDQSGLCPTSATLDATPVAGLTGTWSYVSGPAGSGFVDANDPTTLAYGLTNGTYQFQWTLSGGGCPGTTSDVVQITVDPCVTTVTHDAYGNQTFTGCSYTYTDDGGTGGNYSDNIANTMTTFCPDDPDAFATLTFNTASIYPYDYINVYDDPSPGAPIVASIYYDPSPGGGFVYEPSVGTTITSSTGCLYVQFQSTATNNYPGWTATVGCSPTAGVQNQTFVTVNNCGGGGGITLCASGQVTAESNMDTNPPDLGLANQGCLGSQEGASNTWVYMIAESDGWIAFELQPAGGQDFDYAIWGPYDGGYACPGMTLDEPINCSWAANGGASCDATIGIGTFNTLGNAVLPTDLSEGGFCAPATNEGWTYPIYANAGEVYVLLFQNYGFNNSSFDFFVNEPGTTNIPAGESYASLGCDPVQALPIQLISFTGEHKEGMNYLYWTTASEYQNAYFIIERSDDGMNWEEVTTVQGNGNSSEVNNYATVDRYPFNETTYYRLLQVDYDGIKRRYKTIALASELEVEGLFSNVYPNPTSGTFYFNYGGRDFTNEIVVNVTNSMGQVVYSKTVQQFNASQSIEVDASQFSEGLYNVEIVQGETKEIKRISIIR